jgi:two-component system response regulator RegX3
MSERILIVEDERTIADSVAYALRGAGYEVETVGDGDAALRLAREREWDLMVLDLLLPGTQGLDVCRQVRAESPLPIVILTARDAELDRVVGLELGADDYVTKPFSVAELVSRVRALLRRRELDRRRSGAVRDLGGLHLDIARQSVSVDGGPLQLTRSEFRLLMMLSSDPGRVFTRDELIRHLWQSDFVGDRRAIDVHVSNLRRKIEAEPRRPRRLLTVRGVGYKLVAA